MNPVRYFLPHIFALSTNSPFWHGRNTGLKSYRSKIFDRFPRTGIPDAFRQRLRSTSNYIKLLVKTRCIDNAKKIWWDVRMHPFFNTLEFRICDVPMRVDETLALGGAVPGGHRASSTSCSRRISEFRLYRRVADQREQVAGRALRHHRQADRFRQAGRGPLRRPDPRAAGVRGRRGGRAGEPRRARPTSIDILRARHRRRPPDRRSGTRPNDIKKVVDYIVEETHAAST